MIFRRGYHVSCGRGGDVFTFFQQSVIIVMISESNVNGREKRYAEYTYLRGAHQSLS